MWFLFLFLSGVMRVPAAHHLGLQLLVPIFLALLYLKNSFPLLFLEFLLYLAFEVVNIDWLEAVVLLAGFERLGVEILVH